MNYAVEVGALCTNTNLWWEERERDGFVVLCLQSTKEVQTLDLERRGEEMGLVVFCL